MSATDSIKSAELVKSALLADGFVKKANIWKKYGKVRVYLAYDVFKTGSVRNNIGFIDVNPDGSVKDETTVTYCFLDVLRKAGLKTA